MTEAVVEPVAEEKPADVEGTIQWSLKVRNQAKTLTKDLENRYMDLARLLYTVCDQKTAYPPYEPIYRSWGFTTFAHYAEVELEIHRRKAATLRQIWYRLEVELANMDPAVKKRIIALGWSKVRSLLPVLTMQNSLDWADKAEGLNYKTLVIECQKYDMLRKEALLLEENSGKGLRDISIPVPEPLEYHHKYFSLETSQAEVVEAALQKAAILTDSSSPNHNLVMICTDFIMTNNIGMTQESMLRFLAILEDNIGLRLIAVDPATKSVVYGAGTLQKMSEDISGIDTAA